MAQDINFAAYTSQPSAGDIHDLITVLGYDQVNLFGGSYGSFLALTYLQEYGDEGRSLDAHHAEHRCAGRDLESDAPPAAVGPSEAILQRYRRGEGRELRICAPQIVLEAGVREQRRGQAVVEELVIGVAPEVTGMAECPHQG